MLFLDDVEGRHWSASKLDGDGVAVALTVERLRLRAELRRCLYRHGVSVVVALPSGAKAIRQSPMVNRAGSGVNAVDSGVIAINSGGNAVDSGVNAINLGVNAVDSGANAVDSGANAVDSGANVVDSGANAVQSDGIRVQVKVGGGQRRFYYPGFPHPSAPTPAGRAGLQFRREEILFLRGER